VQLRTERPTVRIVGREDELAMLHGLFETGDGPRTVVLTGVPGIGKTTLWEAGVDAARRRGYRVLLARPSDAEAGLAFATLIDLFDGVETGELSEVPAPQVQALEVALLRAVPTTTPPEEHAIAVGVLNALRALAAREPILVAVDDVQWLDPHSSTALAFAARRLDGGRVGFLLAKRPAPPTPLEHALERGGLESLEVGPLTLGATRRLLHARFGLTLSRQLMRRIFDSTLGNPLFALEVGRKLVEEGLPAIGEDIPVPDAVEDLLGTRVAALPRDVRRLLLAVALSQDLRVGQLAELAGPDSLDAGFDSGVLVVDGEHVRASHPLLAAAATSAARAAERRELHHRLAEVVEKPELRVRHLALATPRPDRVLAVDVASSARDAARRGAVHAAIELSHHALRLTPPDDSERVTRVLELADYLEVAGELEALAAVLTPIVDELPRGEARARAYVRLSSSVADNDDGRRYLERALAETESGSQLRAQVLADLSMNTCLALVERIPESEALLDDALSSAQGAGPEEERLLLYSLAWARALRGLPIDDLCARFRAASDAAFHITTSPERAAAQRLAWRGETVRARMALTSLMALAEERGERTSYALQRLHVCELELRAGGYDVASRLLSEWIEPGERELTQWPLVERCQALLAASRGQPAEARRWAAETIAGADAAHVRWDRLEALRALGTVALLEREAGEAAEALRAVWEHAEREGVEDPGVFPVGPDLVEALAELGEFEEASAVTARLSELAERQEHPWGRASARRCAATVSLAEGHDEQAVAALERAAREYGSLGLAFDRARSLLGLGRAQRRFRKWGAARDTLRAAAAAFDELGAGGWADAARSELSRVGARRPSKPGELTPTERRVAELAAKGLANKEIARALVVTVSTVEFHLSNTYAKLGVRSRGQLAGRLAAGNQPPQAPGS
jgi:DNA-binding NarL/FixJ family response regulator